MAQQKFTIKIDSDFDLATRRAIAEDVIDFIIERSKSGKDKNNIPFADYSEGYINSFDFKLAGKSKKPNLTLTGEMLNSIELLNSTAGNLTIGIPLLDEFNNKKAEGNIKGTYGSTTPNPLKARDFMGISDADLNKIQNKYRKGELGRGDSTDTLTSILAAEGSRRLVSQFFGGEETTGEDSGL